MRPIACASRIKASCGTVSGATGGSSFGTTGTSLGGGNGTLIFLAAVSFASSLVTDPLINMAPATDAASGSTASGSDSNARATSTASADLSMVKTGGGRVIVGATISYLLTIANAGPDAADGATFSDVVPASVTALTATCIQTTGGAACGPVSVDGNEVTGTASLLPKGGTIVIGVNGVATTAGTFVNEATITAPAGVVDPNPANDTGSATTEIGPAPTSIPTLSTMGLALLFVVLAVTALIRQRRGARIARGGGVS